MSQNLGQGRLLPGKSQESKFSRVCTGHVTSSRVPLCLKNSHRDTHLHPPPSYAFWVGPLCILQSTHPHPPILEQQCGWRSDKREQLGLLRKDFTNADGVLMMFDLSPSLNITTQRSPRGSVVSCSIPPPVMQNQQRCTTGLVCLSTLWNGEGFKCGSGGIRGLSVDGGRVIIPEDVQLSWVSISQHAGYHHPVKKDK